VPKLPLDPRNNGDECHRFFECFVSVSLGSCSLVFALARLLIRRLSHSYARRERHSPVQRTPQRRGRSFASRRCATKALSSPIMPLPAGKRQAACVAGDVVRRVVRAQPGSFSMPETPPDAPSPWVVILCRDWRHRRSRRLGPEMRLLTSVER
jgi:hypothetical protein